MLAKERFGAWDVAWGDVHRIRRGDLDLPMPGAGNTKAADPFTTLFMAGAARSAGGKFYTDRGSSWMQLVKYHQGTVDARTILPLGNSNRPTSPHFADQASLFAKRTLKKAVLDPAEIEREATQRRSLVR